MIHIASQQWRTQKGKSSAPLFHQVHQVLSLHGSPYLSDWRACYTSVHRISWALLKQLKVPMRPHQLTKRSEIIETAPVEIKLCTIFELELISIIFGVYDRLSEAHTIDLVRNHVRTHSDPDKILPFKKSLSSFGLRHTNLYLFALEAQSSLLYAQPSSQVQGQFAPTWPPKSAV